MTEQTTLFDLTTTETMQDTEKGTIMTTQDTNTMTETERAAAMTMMRALKGVPVGTEVIARGHEGYTYTYEGGLDAHGFGRIRFGLGSGERPGITEDLKDVAPANAVVFPDNKDARITVTKRPSSERPYGCYGNWYLTLEGDTRGSWHKTKRDALARAVNDLAIVDYWAGVGGPVTTEQQPEPEHVVPTVAALKRALQPGVPVRIINHVKPDLTRPSEVVSANTVGVYLHKDGVPGGSFLDWPKAADYRPDETDPNTVHWLDEDGQPWLTLTINPTEQDTETKEESTDMKHNGVTIEKAVITDEQRAADLAKAEAIHAEKKAAKRQAEIDAAHERADKLQPEVEKAKREWEAAFAALKSEGVDSKADHPLAVAYREASAALNHLNRKQDFAIATGWKSESMAEAERIHAEKKAERMAEHRAKQATEKAAREAARAEELKSLTDTAASMSTEGHTLTAGPSTHYPSMYAVECECGWKPSVAGGADGLKRDMKAHAQKMAAEQPEPVAVETKPEQPTTKGKALAERMREAGIKITPETWAAAKAGTLDWTAAAVQRGDRLTKADRKAMNKMLAEALKAQGFKATGPDWEAAKAGTLAGFTAPTYA